MHSPAHAVATAPCQQHPTHIPPPSPLQQSSNSSPMRKYHGLPLRELNPAPEPKHSNTAWHRVGHIHAHSQLGQAMHNLARADLCPTATSPMAAACSTLCNLSRLQHTLQSQHGLRNRAQQHQQGHRRNTTQHSAAHNSAGPSAYSSKHNVGAAFTAPHQII